MENVFAEAPWSLRREILKAHLRPAFAASMLHEIGVEQIDLLIVERAHLNTKTIADHLTLLGSPSTIRSMRADVESFLARYQVARRAHVAVAHSLEVFGEGVRCEMRMSPFAIDQLFEHHLSIEFVVNGDILRPPLAWSEKGR